MKQPSYVVIPSADKVNQFYVTEPSSIGSISRSSKGFERGRDNILQSRDVNYIRRDFKSSEDVAYLSEPSSENIALYSSDFTNAAYSKTNVSVESNVDAAPNGKLEADRITPSTESITSKNIKQNISTDSGEHTFSVYLKADDEPLVNIVLAQNSGLFTQWGNASFNISEGTVISNTVGSASIEDAYNGWYRVSVTGNAPTSGSQLFRISLGDGGTDTGFIDDAIVAWGFQLEEGPLATSHIETESPSEVRGFDKIYSDVNGVSSYNNPENKLSVYFDVKLFKVGHSNSKIGYIFSSGSEEVSISSNSNNTSLNVKVNKDGDIFTDSIDIGGYNNRVKVLFTFDGVTTKVFVNGELSSTDTSTTLGFTGFNVFSNAIPFNTSSVFNGLLYDFRVYDMTLNDQDAVYLTTS
tara:strand:- start:2081 stop:3310 length:1230 start_codon:yes stop_codon:yes gene_type:complete